LVTSKKGYSSEQASEKGGGYSSKETSEKADDSSKKSSGKVPYDYSANIEVSSTCPK